MRYVGCVIIVAMFLAGCSTIEQPPVKVSVDGPLFPATLFDRPRSPIPPNPNTVGDAGGSAAARYENALRQDANSCWSKFGAVEAQLRAAGQIRDE